MPVYKTIVRSVLILLIFFTLSLSAQETVFPKSWQGTWKGTLEIYSPNGKIAHTVPMELHIAPLASGRWAWKTTYDNKDIRDYELVTLNAEKGQYQIDEKNDILLDLRLFGNKSFTCFEVDGYQIYDSYTFEKEAIIFELTSSVPGQQTKSGKGTEDNPTVTSTPQIAYQKAVLKKVK